LDDQITADQVRAEVRRLIAEVTERAAEEVSDTATFEDDLGVDSLMGLEVMVSIDKKFKIRIPEAEFAKIKNVDDAVEVVLRCCPAAAVRT